MSPTVGGNFTVAESVSAMERDPQNCASKVFSPVIIVFTH